MSATSGKTAVSGVRAPDVPDGSQIARLRQHLQGARYFLLNEKSALFFVLGLTAFLYFWRLDQNGWANPYYSAAAQSAAVDWKAWFFGSADAGSLITIDKTPLSVWVMGLSVRAFGLSSLSILLPQVLMGVITTWLIYKIIRNSQGAAAALFGAAIYASTPVVVLMSRFNNPEPLMGLLVVAAVYFAIKAIERDRWHWFLLSGAALGFAFMAKQVQAFLVLPGIIIGVLFLGSSSIPRRVNRLLGAMGMLVATGGWWIAIVDLWPAAQRPYIGGSAGNSALQLTTGYNGLARFLRFSNEGGAAVPVESQSPIETLRSGLSRLFNADFSQEAAWLVFPSVACALILLILRQPCERSTMSSVALISSVWFLTVLGVLTFAGTMVHTYYTYSLAAPMALVIPLGLSTLWKGRHRPVTRLIGSVVIFASAYLASRILEYSDSWPPGWHLAILATGAAAGLLWGLPAIGNKSIVLLPVAVSVLMGPVMTDLYTINTPQAGTNPLSGPPSNVVGSLSQKFSNALDGKDLRTLQIAFGAPPDTALIQAIGANTEVQTWAAVTVTGQTAARYQLESREPVAALGGWLGLDPAPTLDRFKALVAEGRIGLFIDQPELLDRQTVGDETTKIVEWVRDHFVQEQIGSQTVYNLRQKPVS